MDGLDDEYSDSNNPSYPNRTEQRRHAAASELANLEQIQGKSDADALNDLYNEYADADDLSDYDDEDRTGERMDEQKARLSKEQRAAQTQSQRQASAAARKEAKDAKLAAIAKEKEAAKQAAALAAKDTSQRTLLDSMGTSKGRLDIDKHLQRMGADDDATDYAAPSTDYALRHLKQQQSQAAALGKSLFAGLGQLSDDDDDDDDATGIDLNDALFGDVRESRAIDKMFGMDTPSKTAQPAVALAPLAQENTVVDRLDDQQFDFKAAQQGSKGGKKGPLPASTAAAPAAVPTKASASGQGPISNFKQREADAKTSNENILIADSADVAEEQMLANAHAQSQVASPTAATVPPQELSNVPLCLPQTHGAFYWLDAKEVGPSVYLFGKVLAPNAKTYESCCMRINGMYRSLMFRAVPDAPKEAVIEEIMRKLHQQGIKTLDIKVVNRYYVFDEPDVPREKREVQEWFKVNYSTAFPQFSCPQPIKVKAFVQTVKSEVDGDAPAAVAAPVVPVMPLPGYKFIELCIGADRSLTETLLLKRRFVGGPCFVRFNERLSSVPKTNRASHCKHEYIVSKPKIVFVWDRPFRNSEFNPSAAPPNRGQQLCHPPGIAPSLSGASIQLITQMNPHGTQNEIYAICIALASNSILPDGGRKVAPQTKHVLLIRQWDHSSPLPHNLATVGSSSRLNITPFASEKAMLQWLVGFFEENDPDMFLGHNFVSFTLDVLLHRMQALGIDKWHTISRMHQHAFPALQKGAGGMRDSTYAEREACPGRLICDTYLLSREHHKSSNYKLIALAKELGLKGIYSTGITQDMVEEASPKLTKDFMNTTNSLAEMLGRCLNLATLTFELAYRLDVIPLTKQLCTQSGTTWPRVLIGSRSERIEFLLLHAFYAQKYVLPEKKRFTFNNNAVGGKRLRDAEEGGDTDYMGGGGAGPGEEGGAAGAVSTNRSAKYKGGMVLEPISGLYQDYILLLDFNSLYPSLIQEFSICFTTVNRSSNPNAEVKPPLPEDLTCGVCVKAGTSCNHKMVLPRVIERLVNSRREVKRMMKSERNEDALAQLDIRQRALKLTANSMYGCLGFEFSRFYAQPLAELVTSKGRDTLSNTISLIPTVANSLRVIYGDTDSVMLQTGVKDSLATVRQLGQAIQAAVNKKYKKLEIGIDGVFRSMLLTKKKKYAALSVDNWEGQGDQLSEVIKGLDMVRRDWCPLVRHACHDILFRILRGVPSATATSQHVVQLLKKLSDGAQPDADEDDALQFILSYMQKVAQDIREGATYPLTDFVINKSLTKEPESYKGDSFPHATVALRMKHRKIPVRVGDLIPYVICSEKVKLPSAQKVVTAADVKTEETDNAEVKVEDEAIEDDTTSHQGNTKLSLHAFHEDEVKADPSKHHLNVEWYLSNQIYPPVLRICQYIQGFSAAQLAEYMALKNASSIAAHESNIDGSNATGQGAGSGNTWGVFDTQYLSRFKTDRLEECFPLADAVQIKCLKCNRITNLQPHEYVERNILPLYREKKRDAAFGHNPFSVFPPFQLYTCINCHSPLPLRYVTNTMSIFIQKRIREFYANGGTPKEVARIQSQLSYLRALFDVPHLPGVSPDIIALHKQFALRCLDANGGVCTIAHSATNNGTDPVKELVDRSYRRIHGLRVDTDALFKRMDIF